MKKILLFSFLCIGIFALPNLLNAQCTADNAGCNMAAGQYDNVVIGEVSGDAGQSDGANDAIVEIVGPPGTDIGCMVITDTEWAVLIPAGTVIPADGVFALGCLDGMGSGVGITGGTNGLVAGGIGDFNAGLPIDFDLCDAANAAYYDPAASGFTLDNTGSQGQNGDGEQVFLFLPDGTPHDGIYWDAGGMGNADHVSVPMGMDYTLGDNDGNGTVNDVATTVAGGRGDGGNATAVPILPTGDGTECPCNNDAAPGTFTVPGIGGPNDNGLWYEIPFSDHVGCNSSFIRLDAGTSAGGFGGSPSHTDGEIESAGMGPLGQNIDNGGGAAGGVTSEGFDPTGFTPTACGDPSAEWAYTDHPTPGEANDDPTFIFYADQTVLCDPAAVTFTAEVYNWQHVEDMVTSVNQGNGKTGSYVIDETGAQVAWANIAVAGETTTLTYTSGVLAPGTYTFTLVWDDWTDCCGTSGLSTSNECYESEEFTIVVAEPLVALDMDIDCDAGDAVAGTLNLSSLVMGGLNNTYELFFNGVSQGASTSGVYTLPTTATAPITATVTDASGCSADITININDNCLAPPVCPSDLDNTGTTADGQACPGDVVDLCLDGTDLPAGGMICYYATTDGSDPIMTDAAAATATVGATATQVGCVDIPAAPMATVPTGGPVLNEVMYDPAGPDGSDACEAVEIAGAPGTDLSCYMISDGDFVIVIPDGTTIPADGYFVIASGGCTGAGADYALSEVDLILNGCGCTNGTGEAFNLTNGGEHVGFYDPTGAVVDGIIFEENVDGDNNGPNGQTLTVTNPAGCTNNNLNIPTVADYDNPPAPWAYIGGDNANGSIGRDVDVTGGWIETMGSGAGASSIGASNEGAGTIMPPACFQYTIPDVCGDSPATIRIEGLITPIDPLCVDAEFNYVGAESTFMVECPSAELVAMGVDVCAADAPAGADLTVNLSGLATGNYALVYAIDGVAQPAISVAAPATTATINIPTPTAGEVKVTLVSVFNDADGSAAQDAGECSGTVIGDEVCVNIRPMSAIEITASTDPTGCAPADGTITIDGPAGVLFDIEYTGGTLAGVTLPTTVTDLGPGTYEITGATDEGGCPVMINGAAVVLAAPGASVVSAMDPAPACVGDGPIDLATLAMLDGNGTDAGALTYYGVDPRVVPGAPALGSSTVTSTGTYYIEYNEGGCISYAEVNITVNPDPVASTDFAPADCAGNGLGQGVIDVNITVSGGTPGYMISGLGVTNQAQAADGTAVLTPTDVAPSTVTIEDANGCMTTLDLSTYTADCLPVELTDFRGEYMDEKVRLTWNTSTELNNSHFVVERSLDGAKFVELAKVEGAGTTVEPQSYEYFDLEPKRINYYRLKQVDFDGTYEYTVVIVVNTSKDDLGTKVFPVPTSEILVVETAREINTIEVMDITGRIVMVSNFDTATRHELNVSTLVAGTYFVSVKAENGVEMIRFIKK